MCVSQQIQILGSFIAKDLLFEYTLLKLILNKIEYSCIFLHLNYYFSNVKKFISVKPIQV